MSTTKLAEALRAGLVNTVELVSLHTRSYGESHRYVIALRNDQIAMAKALAELEVEATHAEAKPVPAPVAVVVRLGLNSQGKAWHGVMWEKGVDLPEGALLYAAPAAPAPEPSTAQVPLTRKRINKCSADAQAAFCASATGTYEEAFAREVEKAHGIGIAASKGESK